MEHRVVKKIVVVLALVACGDNDLPADDGYGGPCNVNLNDTELFTACKALLGQDGVCAQIMTGDVRGICRRWCDGDETNPVACPKDQRAIVIQEGRCLCQP